MKRALAAALVIFFASFPAMAAWKYTYNGNMLIENMREYDKANRGDSNTDWGKAWAFRGYVFGVFDTANGALFCPPDQITSSQTLAIVAKHLEENPAQWTEPASTLVIQALAQAFPCKKSR